MKDDVIRVLLVDGAPEVCDRLALLITNEGMTPVVAHDAKTALDRIRLTSPDLLVTDFRLPDLDGFELLQRAKRLDNNLPVVIMTAHAEINGAVKAIKASAFHYMEKPLNGPDFIQVVREGLAERRLKLKQSSTIISATHHLVETMGPSERSVNWRSRSTGSPNRISASLSSVKPELAKRLSHERFTTPVRAESARLYRSIVERFLMRCWKRNSSVTKRGLSQERSVKSAGNLNWPTAALCSWTRS